MAAPIRLVGGISRPLRDHQERQRGESKSPQLTVAVGKSQTLRPIPLTEEQILGLIEDGAKMLDLLRKEREQ